MGEVIYIAQYRKAREERRRKVVSAKAKEYAERDIKEATQPASDLRHGEDD